MTRSERKTSDTLGVKGEWPSAACVFLYHDEGITTVYVLGHEVEHRFPGDLTLEQGADSEVVESVRLLIREHECITGIRASIEGDTIHLALSWVDGRVGEPFSYTGAFAVRWL